MDSTGSNIYLLLGPELGQKSEFVEKLYAKSKITSMDLFVERCKFYPYDTEVSDILTVIRTPSLFSSVRFICLADLDFFKAADLQLLFKSFWNVDTNVWIVLMSSQIQVKKIHPSLEKVVDKKKIYIFWEMFTNRKHQWIRLFFNKRDVEISFKAIEKLLSLVDNGTQGLVVACEALIWKFRSYSLITEENIEEFVVHTKEENVFTLFAHIFNSDLNTACLSLMSLLLNNENLGFQILSGLLWQFRRLTKILELVHDGITLDDAFKKMMITSKSQKEFYRPICIRFHLRDAREILFQLVEREGLLRFGFGLPKSLQKIVLESCVVYLCQTTSSFYINNIKR